MAVMVSGALLLGPFAALTVLSAMMHAGFVASVYVELRQVREGFAVPTLAEVFA